MMKTGVSAIKVEAMPASVYCTAISESDTPMNGPVMVAHTAAFIPLKSRIEVARVWNCFWNPITQRKPIAPVTARMKVEAKGIDNDLDGGSTFWPLWFTKDKLIGVLPDDALEMKELMEYDNPVLQIGY